MTQYRIAIRTDHLWYSTRLLCMLTCLTARANTSKTQIMADSMMQVFFGQVDADRLELLASV